jgi:ribosomal peptide maturation radical SAM protein 1
MNPLRLALIAMPWANHTRPSCALSALSAYIERHLPEVAISVRSEYVEVAQLLGEETYDALAQECYRIGELLYAALLYPTQRESVRAVFLEWARERIPPAANEGSFDALLGALSQHADTLALAADSLDVAGFTCSFGQTFASLLVAKRMKERNPRCEILFGGSSVSRTMGPSLLHEYPFLDFVFQGEGELPLTDFLRSRLSGEPFSRREILGRDAAGPSPTLSAEIGRMDDLPMPDYGDYAERAERYGIDWALPIEGSRGCWWDRTARTGDPTQTCYFCSVNVQWNGYREKTVDRIVEELATLSGKYRVTRAFFVDNIIRLKGVETLAEKIIALGRDYELFYEARANLQPHELLAMWEAGLRASQFGIEGLSSAVLKKVGKGTTALQNLQVMRLLTEFEIEHGGNLITGFPGTTDEEVAETVRTIRTAASAYQPLSVIQFFLQRGSTVDVLRERYELKNVRNRDWYRPGLPEEVWRRIHMFDVDFDTEVPLADWTPVYEAAAEWRARYRGLNRKLVVYRDCVEFLQIEDRRQEDLRSGSFDGLAREVYLACLETQGRTALHARFPEASERELSEIIDFFVEQEVMACEGDRVLSLAVATAPHIAARRIKAERQRALSCKPVAQTRRKLAVVD